jgi:hypothetical protein
MGNWKVDEMEDTRNWELMPAIGGLRTSVGDLTRLVVDKPGDLRRKAAILASFDGGSTTGEVETVCPLSLCIPILTEKKMSGNDDAFYSALYRLSQRIDGGQEPLSGLFDGMPILYLLDVELRSQAF